MEETTTNNAILTAKKLSIFTIDTADIMLVLDLPANELQFQLTYNPNVFQFIPSSVQCSLQEINVDSTSTPGIIKFSGRSQDPNVTATSVNLSFRPLQAVSLAGFIASGLVTNTGATLTIPTVNMIVNLTPIHSIRPLPLNPDNPPMVGATPPYIALPDPLLPPMPLLNGTPVPPVAMPPINNDGTTNNAFLGTTKTSIETIENANLFLALDMPASSIEFNVTYNPNVFQFLPGSVQCSLPWANLDYSKPGVVSFKFMSQDPNITATTVSFSFKPLMAVPLSGFIANGLVTNTNATLSVPTVNITVNTTPISIFHTLPLNPDIPPIAGAVSTTQCKI